MFIPGLVQSLKQQTNVRKSGTDFQHSAGNSMGEKINLFYIWYWDYWIYTYKRITLNPFLTPYTKINSRWITEMILQLLQENADVCDLGLFKTFLDMPNNKWQNIIDFLKIKNFCTSEDTSKMKIQHTVWEKILSHVSDKDLYQNISSTLTTQ